MKKVLAFLLVFGRDRARPVKEAFHDDTLRANQGQDRGQAFSFWRALVS
jgi:hypothetical protein